MRTSWSALCPPAAVICCLLISLSVRTAHAQFNYVTNDGTITITKYTGAGGEVTIPGEIDGLPVTAIGDEAFAISDATRVTIPGSVTNIGISAFHYCTDLTAILVDPLNGFYSSVDGVLFDEPLTTLLQYPGGKSGSYAIPEGVMAIAPGAFFQTADLPEVRIPQSVTTVGDYAFASCGRLTAITVDARNPVYTSADGVLFAGGQARLIQYPAGKAGNYTIPDSVTTIGNYGFYACSQLTGVTIPNSVTSIGLDAFSRCTSLVTVTLPNRITAIQEYTFYDCTSLASVTMPNGVTRVEQFAFFGCSSLTNVIFSDTLTRIHPWAFRGCTSLTAVTIPGSVVNIGDYAFFNCTSLVAAYFEGNTPRVGTFAFNTPTTLYYLPGAAGWGPAFAGRPAAPWVLSYPVILCLVPDFGIKADTFGFTISWASNASVVVEASLNLEGPTWVPVGTNTLISGASYFSDTNWSNYTSRCYRIRWP